MNTNTQRKCADRVQAEWLDIKQNLDFWMEHGADARLEDGEGSDFYEYGLSFDYVPAGSFTDQEVGYFRFQISWGGPSEEIRFYAEGREYDWNVMRAEYWFLDWFDGAHKVVTQEPCIRWLFEQFAETGTCEAKWTEAQD